jgi:hypothetical protein
MSGPDPHNTEETVDRLEEKILGHTVDQRRDEVDEPSEPRQAVEADRPAEDHPGSEPAD